MPTERDPSTTIFLFLVELAAMTFWTGALAVKKSLSENDKASHGETSRKTHVGRSGIAPHVVGDGAGVHDLCRWANVPS